MATKALMTVEEFARMETADSEAYELVDGELVLLPSATPLHNVIRGRLEQVIRNYFDRQRIGGAVSETNCRIGDDTIRKPDLSIFLAESWARIDLKKTPVPFAPDIAIEVLSPSEHATDVNRKIKEYLRAGSQEVWLLDPENGELQVWTKTNIQSLQGDAAVETSLLPGFSVILSEILKQD
jgi:Uma2 family endonuclease